MNDSPSGIHLTTAPTLASLVDVGAQWISKAVRDPFDFPVICLDDAGTRRWLTYQWAQRFGASQGHRDGICAGIQWMTLERWLSAPRTDRPLTRAELALAIVQSSDSPQADWAQLSGMDRSAHTFWRAWHLAGLFERYRAHRPDLLRAFEEHREDLTSAPQTWQAQLWRSITTRTAKAIESVPAQMLLILPRNFTAERAEQLLDAARTHRVDVLLSEPASADSSVGRSFGQLARTHVDWFVEHAQSHRQLDAETCRTTSVLGRLQVALRTGEELSGPADASVRWWGSHGLTRQVEVLREKLTELFEEIPELAPSDVVIRCPRPHLYAARLRALTSPALDADAHPGRQLRIDVVDPAAPQENCVLRALARICELSTARCTASEVLGLLREEAVAHRFEITPVDAERLEELVHEAGIRWGIDADHTRAFGFDSGAHTWSAGIDRLTAGIALSADEQLLLGETAPVDDVTDHDAVLVGKLLLFFSALRDLIAQPEPRRCDQWLHWCRKAIDTLCAPPPALAWHLSAARSLLADAEGEQADGPLLTLSDFRIRLEPLWTGHAGRPRFGSGGIVVCGPGQLTGVPHRVTIVMGVDEGEFPATALPDGDDLITAGERRPLDPWPADEDRQFLLDAAQSTEDVFAVLYAARDDFTGSARAMSRPVAVLREYSERLSDGVLPLTTSGLQPYSLGAEPTFDTAAHEGARALAGPREPAPSLFASELPPLPLDTISLERLARFLLHPATALLTEQGGISRQLPDPEADTVDVELDGLSRWKVGDRLLRASLSGLSIPEAVRAELASGTLPPTRRTVAAIEKVGEDVASLTARYRQVQAGAQPLRQYPFDVVAAGVNFTGAVDVVGDDIVDVTFSSSSPRALVRGWVKLLALSTAEPGRRWRWVMMGNRGTTFLGPLPNPTWGEAVLTNLLELFQMGTREPLPLPLQLGHLYATKGRHYGREDEALRRLCFDEWKASVQHDPDWLTFYPTFDDLWAATPRVDDSHTITDEPRRLGVLARRLWQPLLAAGAR